MLAITIRKTELCPIVQKLALISILTSIVMQTIIIIWVVVLLTSLPQQHQQHLTNTPGMIFPNAYPNHPHNPHSTASHSPTNIINSRSQYKHNPPWQYPKTICNKVVSITPIIIIMYQLVIIIAVCMCHIIR